MRRIVSVSLFFLVWFIATGCASGYAQFYQSVPGVTPQTIAATRAAPPPKVPPIHRAAESVDDAIARYARTGYVLIGYSHFNSGMDESDWSAQQQAKRVRADLVAVYEPEFVSSTSSSVPITMPTRSTSYTNGTATAYGSGGFATAYGNSTTTTYGSSTTYVPVTVNRYNYGALFFIKMKVSFGAYWRDLDDTERRALQTNKGVYITTIVDDSPAYENDVLVGDVIVAVNGQAVNGTDGFLNLLKPNNGKSIDLTIIRDGSPISKSVTLRN